MGKKIKKGKVGEVSKYVSRAKALRKLQVSLKDFRRLCILKGVYPREPPKKLARTGQTYYHIKDVNFLATERTLERFRAMKTYLKKVTKAKHRGDETRVKYLKAHKPQYSLNHLVRERYPTFVDALRDLDDPLCLINLVAAFAATRSLGVAREVVQECIRLQREFNLFVIRSHALRKAFVSIKGVYFQAEIQGQTVTWVQPHQLPAQLPVDVDYRVMMTFLEFYRVLLKFVNYRLYQQAGAKYPPDVDAHVEDANLFSYQALRDGKDTQAGTNTNSNNSNDAKQYEIDDKFKNDPETSKYLHADAQQTTGLLFEKAFFWLSSEAPKSLIEFVILAHGGRVHWLGDGHNVEASDARITHYITDRKANQVKVYKGREYVQPQWIFDSVNAGILLPVRDYALGKLLPPHLSPFVQKDQLTYLPEREKEIRRLKGEVVDEEDDQNGLGAQKDAANGEGDDDDDEGLEEEYEDDAGDEEEDDNAFMKKKLAMFEEDQGQAYDELDQDSYGISGSEDDDDAAAEEEEEVQVSDEEAQEVRVRGDEDDADGDAQYDHEKEIAKKQRAAQKKQKESKDLAKNLMSRKNANLYERIVAGKKKKEEKEALLKKKAKIIKKKKALAGSRQE